MRTTIDLPDDLHAVVGAIARDSGMSLNEVLTRLVRAALGAPGAARVSTSPRTGLRVVSSGRVITSADVRALEDDE